MKIPAVIILLIFYTELLPAQNTFYNPHHRPAGLNWQQISTDHFRIIFPEGEDSLAFRSAAILEQQFPSAAELTGGTLKNFPVILKNYNDLSNGFVTSLNFRSEIDLSPLKGKNMNPRTGDWLETVLPHELVHATHFNVQQDKSEQVFNLPNIISYFSPDFARSFHGFAPVGVHEGLAVYYETEEISEGGGRGNYTISTNRFNANFGSPHRWNMGQTLIPSDYSLPNNRHYIAGYTFTDWLHENYGNSVSRDAIRAHYSNFLLGYGYALRRATGKWPAQLYNSYEQELEQRENKRQSEIEVNTTKISRFIDVPFKGRQMRRPTWISDQKLLFYGSFYNRKLGFYQYELDSDEISFLEEAFTVGDYNYEISFDSLFYFSTYSRHPLYSGVYIADIYQKNISTGENFRRTQNKHVYAPTIAEGRIIGIQTEGSSAKIVEVLENGELNTLHEFKDATPISIKVNPSRPNQAAVVVNQRGSQALWIISLLKVTADLKQPPAIAFRDGSIHDPHWHPKGEKLLFTMDAPPAANIYEYNLKNSEVTQITSSVYNAFEASYSPDGNSIAYVVQDGDEHQIAVLDSSDFLKEPVANNQLLSGAELQERLNRPLLGHEILDENTWGVTKYRAGFSWLKPRIIFPVFREISGATQFGAGFSSIDALSGQSYSAEITGIQDRLWYDFTYSNKTFFPGFEIRSYSEPEFFITNNPHTGDSFSLMREDRGFSLSIPTTYTFRGDTRLSSIYLNPEVSAEQFRYFDLSPNALSDYSTRYRAGIFSQLDLGIQSLTRDVQPSAGFSVFGLLEHTLNETEVDINFEEGISRFFFGKQWSAYYGAFTFLSPLRKFNQSLRLDLRFLQQSSQAIYSNNIIVPLGFKDSPFPASLDASDHLARFSTRYTIPLLFPDTGVLTVPLYLSSIYLTTFSHTLTNLSTDDLVDSSRSIFGAGVHIQFKLSNVLLDFGVGIAYEPTRNETQFIFGQF